MSKFSRWWWGLDLGPDYWRGFRRRMFVYAVLGYIIFFIIPDMWEWFVINFSYRGEVS